jgi:hypothetical protein
LTFKKLIAIMTTANQLLGKALMQLHSRTDDWRFSRSDVPGIDGMAMALGGPFYHLKESMAEQLDVAIVLNTKKKSLQVYAYKPAKGRASKVESPPPQLHAPFVLAVEGKGHIAMVNFIQKSLEECLHIHRLTGLDKVN